MDPQSSGSKLPPLPLRLPGGKEVRICVSSEGTATVMPEAKVEEKHRGLFEAMVKADWTTVEKILNEEDGEAMKATVKVGNEEINALEYAVMAAQDQHQLVKKLITCLPPNSEEYNSILKSALYDAARRGRIIMVKVLVEMVNSKPDIVGLALSHATTCAPMQKEVIWYLARQATSAPDFHTMSCLILAGHIDISLFLARRHPGLATCKDNEKRSLLGDLAKMKSSFRSEARLNFWENCIYKCIPLCFGDTSFDNSKDKKMARALNWFKTSLWNLATKSAPFIKRIRESKSRHKCSLEFVKLALNEKKKSMETSKIVKFLLDSGILLDSANRGILEIVELCLDQFPELMWDKYFPKTLMTEVVKGRQVELFRVVNAYNRAPKLSEDIFTYPDLMEAVVEWQPECVPANVPGAAVLMQREFQWFKVLEERSYPSFRSLKFEVNKSDDSSKSLKWEKAEGRKGNTYWQVFVEQRKNLLIEAGQWMKDTSSSCSLVATLIITITFTAALTVPGGNDNNTGIPIFLKKGSFMIFAVADALALFSSVTAALMFLAIVTPCYTIEDILHSLPRKMIMGITFLFLSLAFMLVAFGSALTIVLSERLKWIYIPVSLLATVPLYFFLNIQFPMYVEMVKSIYWPRLYSPLKLRKKRGRNFNFRISSTKAS